MWPAEQPDVIFTWFGDMMRVPGSKSSLLEAKARGADVRFVYSPLDALKLAVDHPTKKVVFFAVGFETTAPSTAVTLIRARELGVSNFSVFSNHVTIVPPLKAILDSPDAPVRVPRSRPRLDRGRQPALPLRARGLRQADRGRGLRTAGHPRLGSPCC